LGPPVSAALKKKAHLASGSETASTKRKKGQGIEGQRPAKKSKGEGLFIFKYEWERLVRLQLDNEQNVALIPEFFRAL
jgi:hypothetical protein